MITIRKKNKSIKKMVKKIGILGAGISGLYSAFLLTKKGFSDITIHEKDSSVGGRLFSYKFDKYTVEGGGSVFREDSVHVISLLEFFDIDYKPIPKELCRILKKDGTNLTSMPRKKLIQKVCKNSTCDETFEEACHRILKNKNEIDCVLLGTSYGEILESEAKLECEENLWDEYLFVDQNYYYVQNGFSSLIHKLKTYLLKQGVQILLNSEVQKISKPQKWKIETQSTYFSYDLVISTIPYYFFKTIKLSKELKNWKKLMDERYFYLPYIRIYSQLDGKLKNNTIICSDGKCGRIIPIDNNEKGTFLMSVYTDGTKAEYWKNKNGRELNKSIQHHLRKIIPDVPNVLKSKKFFWDFGISSWRPGDICIRNLMDNIQNPTENIYFVGESYALLAGWIEGSLRSVEFLESISV